MSVAAKKQRKAEVLEGILETMETDGVEKDWVFLNTDAVVEASAQLSPGFPCSSV